MDDYMALIVERTALRAWPVPLLCTDTSTVVARIMELPRAVAAVFVLGLSVSESVAVQARVAEAGGPPVVTELDALTTTLAAAAASTLRRRRLGPRHGRVAVLGAESAPKLEPVLLASGAGSVTNWFEYDASSAPLPQIMHYNDMLIDLTGTASQAAAPGRTVVIPTDPFRYAALPLPGLLSALCGHGATELTVDALAASASALALITPVGSTLPDPHHRLLVSAVSRRVTRILADRSLPGAHPHT